MVNEYWHFNSLAHRIDERNFISIGICVAENPRQQDVCTFEIIIKEDVLEWLPVEKDDAVYKQLRANLDAYLESASKPLKYGVDFTVRELTGYELDASAEANNTKSDLSNLLPGITKIYVVEYSINGNAEVWSMFGELRPNGKIDPYIFWTRAHAQGFIEHSDYHGYYMRVKECLLENT